jgi:hypothetical protein
MDNLQLNNDPIIKDGPTDQSEEPDSQRIKMIRSRVRLHSQEIAQGIIGLITVIGVGVLTTAIVNGVEKMLEWAKIFPKKEKGDKDDSSD